MPSRCAARDWIGGNVYRILLAGDLDGPSEARLAAAATVVRVPASDEQALIAALPGCDALVAHTHTPVTRRVLVAGDKLRVVGVAGVGLDCVDLPAAADLGVEVLSTPEAACDAVADLTLAFMLQLLRPIPRLAEEYRRGRFRAAREEPHGVELGELTVGVVGMGRIGSRVGRRCAAGFGARVLYNDIVDVGPFEFSAEAVDKDTLWREADILTLHVPLTAQTRRLVEGAVLARCRKTALLINTARGAVVDTGALTEALLAGRLGGVALDVVEPEPLPVGHALFECERCILTPHIAARTRGGLRRMYGVVDAVLEALKGIDKETG